MKVSIIAAALALGAAVAATPAVAQPGTVTQTRIVVGSTEPSAETPQAARHEAGAALAEARRDCRKEQGREAQESCLADAREDHRRLMEMARQAS
jgi:hypothetical protein